MNRNMYRWLENLESSKKALPVLSFPGIQLLGITVRELVKNGNLQAQCMKAVADRYDTAASVSNMDLSVEAEAFGAKVIYSDDEVPTVFGRLVDTEDDAYDLKIPKVGAGRTGEYLQAIRKASTLIKDRPVLAGMIGPFSLAGRLMELTEAMVKCLTEPEVGHEVLRKATDFLIDYALAFKQAGADGIVMAEPAAGLLSPAMCSEFSSAYVKRIIEAVEDEGFLVVYHNCGNTIPLVDSILETGARAVHLGNAVDMAEALEAYPRNIVVMGNVDPASVLRKGPADHVRAETTKLLERCNQYPNWVVSTGCDIPPMTPLDHIDAFFEAVEDFYKDRYRLELEV